MFGASELTDNLVATAVDGEQADTTRILELVSPQVELMVTARLSPTPGRLHDVQEITQLAMVALSQGLPRLRTRTVRGLRAFMSGIVARKVADHLNRRGESDLTGPRPGSLDASVSGISGTAPLWQLLSAGGRTPASEAARGELFEHVMLELGNLKPEHREAITLAFFDQMSTREIAERMDMSRPAASMLLLRAVNALRHRMNGATT